MKIADMILVQDLPGGAHRHILVPMALTVDALVGEVAVAFVLHHLEHGKRAFQEWAAQRGDAAEFTVELRPTEDGALVAVYEVVRPELRAKAPAATPGAFQVGVPEVAWLAGGPKGEA